MATIYLHKQKLFNNLNKISKINPNIIAVIKDNAYGHGIITFSKMLKEYGIKKVCVRDIKEAEIVRDFFEEVILFFPPTSRGAKNFSYAINSISQLKKNRHPYIHLKIDTGMHRNGILLNEIEEALEIILKKEFEVRGVFSHFCCADEEGVDTFIQYERFKYIKEKIVSFFKNHSLSLPYFHLANSAALEKLDDTFDYVRPGIAIYGGIEGYEGVMELRANVISNRVLKAKEGCGYNKFFITNEDIVISTVHKAKGLEWDNVIIPHCNNGTYPFIYSKSEREKLEDARLLYVALSRAKKRILVTYSKELSVFLKTVKYFFNKS